MGEIADMMLDGTLDHNGEYTGGTRGYPWSESETATRNGRNSKHSNRGIIMFLDKELGLNKFQAYKFCVKYCESENKNKENSWKHLSKTIQLDWNKFKKYCIESK